MRALALCILVLAACGSDKNTVFGGVDCATTQATACHVDADCTCGTNRATGQCDQPGVVACIAHDNACMDACYCETLYPVTPKCDNGVCVKACIPPAQ